MATETGGTTETVTVAGTTGGAGGAGVGAAAGGVGEPALRGSETIITFLLHCRRTRRSVSSYGTSRHVFTAAASALRQSRAPRPARLLVSLEARVKPDRHELELREERLQRPARAPRLPRKRPLLLSSLPTPAARA